MEHIEFFNQDMRPMVLQGTVRIKTLLVIFYTWCSFVPKSDCLIYNCFILQILVLL